MLANILSRYWWMTLIRGLVGILFGLMLFAKPGISLVSLVLVFGAFALVDEIANIITAIGGRREHPSWWILLLAGPPGLPSDCSRSTTPG